jgi:predicted phosphodiesterase
MASNPKLLSLFWRTETASLPKERTVRVALQHLNVLDELPPVPAVLLYPAFLTPGVHVAGDNDGMFEILILARSNPPLTASDVNLHLKMTDGLDPFKKGSNQPLFGKVEGNITIKKVVPDANGTLATEKVFRGQLDKRMRDRLKNDSHTKELDTFWAIRIHESCLNDKAVTEGGLRTATQELQDELVRATLQSRNGVALREENGRGTCCFAIGASGCDMSKVDTNQPIRAYHPLCFYPAGALAPASFGHVSDIHLNARQQILRRTPARVIDDPRAITDSPPIGGMVNVYEQSFHEILQTLGSDQRVDVLFAGGDFMDHANNLYPYQQGQDTARLNNPSARLIWELMDVRAGHGYETNYQSFVDFICLFGEIRWFCDSFSKPIFGVTGNHDCYEGAYGISPRATFAWVRANAGIPADHNLTFYEAILSFGESYHHMQALKSPFNKDLLEWYSTIFTPFSDFAVALPNQELVGLAWGDSETSVADAGGQGVTHLPRADSALSDPQWALFTGRHATKKTVLFSHFTFVSYVETVPEQAPNAPRQINTEGQGAFSPGHPFSDFDMGTFYKHRPDLYAAVADSTRTQFAVSGHSHRHALYYLGTHQNALYATEMHPIGKGQPVASGRTPIIVSDSAGPTPRKNIHDEFGPWGSDRPAGTLISVSGNQVQSVEAIAAGNTQAKPRLAVALDYAHAVDNNVFDEIETGSFPSNQARRTAHTLNIRFKANFPGTRYRLTSLALYCRVSPTAPWRQIPMTVGAWQVLDRRYRVQCRATATQASAFFEWLTTSPRAGRFMSMRFATTDPTIDAIYEQQSAWNLQVDCRPALSNMLPWTDNSYVINPRDGALSTEPWNEVPDFAWRRRFPEYQ